MPFQRLWRVPQSKEHLLPQRSRFPQPQVSKCMRSIKYTLAPSRLATAEVEVVAQYASGASPEVLVRCNSEV